MLSSENWNISRVIPPDIPRFKLLPNIKIITLYRLPFVDENTTLQKVIKMTITTDDNDDDDGDDDVSLIASEDDDNPLSRSEGKKYSSVISVYSETS